MTNRINLTYSNRILKKNINSTIVRIPIHVTTADLFLLWCLNVYESKIDSHEIW